MDNVTHTLVGVAVGHALARRPSVARDPDRVRAIVWASMLGNNLPDLDFVLRFLGGTFSTKLGYLLHHRGYSHGFLAVPFLAALAAAGAALIARRGFRRGFGELVGVGALGVCLHVAADSMNDYGVHPLSPFVNRWFYGDFIFILEPLLWLALIPLAVQESRSRAGRWIWTGFGLAVIAVGWIGPILTWPVAVFLTLWALLVAAAQRRAGGVLPAFGATALVLAAFAAGAGVARSEIRAAYQDQVPAEKILQLATTPAPADPFCWRTIVASTTPGGQYVARIGSLSLAPSALPPERCVYNLSQAHSAPLSASTLRSTPGLVWTGEFRGELSELRALGERNCHAAAFFRYARLPFWTRSELGLIVGDLRYDRGKGLGFAEFLIEPAGRCPENVPPWEPPL